MTSSVTYAQVHLCTHAVTWLETSLVRDTEQMNRMEGLEPQSRQARMGDRGGRPGVPASNLSPRGSVTQDPYGNPSTGSQHESQAEEKTSST